MLKNSSEKTVRPEQNKNALKKKKQQDILDFSYLLYDIFKQKQIDGTLLNSKSNIKQLDKVNKK